MKDLLRRFLESPTEAQTPTNKHAATRPYCAKYSRAKIDIGGEKQCPACRDEERAASTSQKK